MVKYRQNNWIARCSIWGLIAVVLFLSGIATGCLDLIGKIRLNDDLSGVIEISYLANYYAWELVDPATQALLCPLPRDEEDLRRQLAGIDGVRLIASSFENTVYGVDASFEVAFDSADGVIRLGGLWSGGGGIVVESESGSASWSHSLFANYPIGEDDRFTAQFQREFGDRNIELTLFTPASAATQENPLGWQFRHKLTELFTEEGATGSVTW